MSRAQDQAFATRASRGDVEAFRLLVEEHSGLVYRVALRILGVEDAQDASQEVWVRVWRSIKKLSYAEIAWVLEVPDETAKGWVSRGRAAMLTALAEENHGRHEA